MEKEEALCFRPRKQAVENPRVKTKIWQMLSNPMHRVIHVTIGLPSY